MKRHTVFALLLFMSTMITTQTKTEGDTYNTYNVSATSNNEVMLMVMMAIKTSMENTFTWFTTFFQPETIAKNSERLKDFCGQTWQLVSDHKKKLIGTGIISSYAFLLYKALKGNSYLAQNDLWFSWKKELSMEQLLSIPQGELAQTLLTRVQRRYVNAANPTDFLSPLINFMRDVEIEINQLRTYNRIYKWTSTISLSKIVPFNKKRFETIQEKIQRLLYFKNVFSSWIANYKMVHNTSEQR